LTPICTKSFVGWGFAPDPLDVFRGVLLKEGERRGEKGREGVRPLPWEKKEKSVSILYANMH